MPEAWKWSQGKPGDIIGTAFMESIGKPGEEGDTYIKMVEWNIKMVSEG